MKAKLLLRSREILSETAFVERVLWQLPESLPGSAHRLKYRLAFVVDGVCVVRYDNERGKGDHRHVDTVESEYRFSTPEALLDDFWRDVAQWRQAHEHRDD
jgi:hypothetical protein